MTTNFPKPLDKQVAAISDSMSQTQDGLAIVANGNTHAAISSGQFVYVKNHDTLAEGLYKATSAIAQDSALSTSNLTADGTGGLNDLQSQVTALNSNIAELRNKFTWNRLALVNGSASASFDLTGYNEVLMRVQDTSSATAREASVIFPVESFGANEQVYYSGAYIANNVGFGVAIGATNSTAHLLTIGANGERISTIGSAYSLVIYAR